MFIEIESFDEPGIEIYIDLSERQLCHILEPAEGYFIAESAYVIERALNAGFEPVSMLSSREVAQGEAAKVVEMCSRSSPAFPVYIAPAQLLSRVKGFLLTRGVLCAMKRKPLPSVYRQCCKAKRIAVLEDVMNPVNVGSIFRSAAALGVDAVLLTEGCTDPLYRRAERVSMGTVFQIPWTYISWDSLRRRENNADFSMQMQGDFRQRHKKEAWPLDGIAFLQDLGFQTVAMALTDQSLSLADPVLKQADKLAIVMGSEGYGLRQETIDACSYTVKIPMAHGVDSLNVAAASAVAFWELRAGQ